MGIFDGTIVENIFSVRAHVAAFLRFTILWSTNATYQTLDANDLNYSTIYVLYFECLSTFHIIK